MAGLPPINRFSPMAPIKRPRPSGMTVARRSWVRLNNIELIEYNHFSDFVDTLNPAATKQRREYMDAMPEHGDEIILYFNTKSRTSVGVNLSAMTTKELEAFVKMVNNAVQKAKPITKMRDRITEETYREFGDDTNLRLYREVPKISMRKGSISEHDQGVHLGPEGTAEVQRGAGDSTGETGIGDGPVAERDKGNGGTAHNKPKISEPPSIFKMGQPF